MEKNPSKQEFTARQKEILALVRKGLTNVEICRILNISANTVKVHLAKIYKIMDVSNRTEAASLGVLDTDDSVKRIPEIKILIVRREKFDNPQMNVFFFLFVQHLHRYHLFNIQYANAESRDEDATYQIVLTGTQDPRPSLYLTLFNGNMSRILWVYSQKFDEHSDIEFLSNQMTMHLYRQMVVSAGHSFERGENLQPRWWFVSAYVNHKMNCKNRESFEKCECELLILLQTGVANMFMKFSLVRLYYTAITETWVKFQKYYDKIQELACSCMRDDPYSDYSRLMMALFNILSGNKKDAIMYLSLVTEANPQNVWASMLLSQMSLFMGEEEKALALFNEYERYFPNLENDPCQIIPKALIYFLMSKYDECEHYALRAAYIRPESIYPLLFVILCRYLKGDSASVEVHKKILFQYHPNFIISDSLKLLDGIQPSRLQMIQSLVEKAFERTNP